MTQALRSGVAAFPDRECGFSAGAGCRKVRRGDGTRRPDDGPPSPPSGSRRLTRVFAPRDGTLRAASRANGASLLATPGPRRAPAPAGRLAEAISASAEGLGAVDRERPSDIVDQSKKVEIPRGLQVFYQFETAFSQAAPARLEGPVGAARRIPRAAPLPGTSRNHPDGASRSLRESAVPREAERSMTPETPAPPGGTSLAALAGRGALPRGSGGRAGRRRHERVRFGIGQAWVRARRDAPHLLHGCARA
jgi:hypothetical protein